MIHECLLDKIVEYHKLKTLKSAFSQVSVIRGRVQSKDGTPLVGVKVDIEKQPLYGYTRTRSQGM